MYYHAHPHRTTRQVKFIKFLSIGLLAMSATVAQAANVTFSKVDSLHALTDNARGDLSFPGLFPDFLQIMRTVVSTSSAGISLQLDPENDRLLGVAGFKLTSADVDIDTRQLHSAQFTGDFKITTLRSFATRSGWLAMSNLNIDLASGTVRASVSGGNGFGQRDDVPLWTFDNSPARLDVSAGLNTNLQDANCAGQTCRMTLALASSLPLELTSLRLTDEALDVFTQSLSLTPAGISVIRELPYSAHEVFSISAVPEPDAWALTLAGALSVAAIASRKRKAQKA